MQSCYCKNICVSQVIIETHRCDKKCVCFREGGGGEQCWVQTLSLFFYLPLQSHVFIDYAINERLVIISFRKTSIY